MIKFTGKPMTVRIGKRYLEPGDEVSEADCDAASIERLAKRSDFEGTAKPKSTPKPKPPAEDLTDG